MSFEEFEMQVAAESAELEQRREAMVKKLASVLAHFRPEDQIRMITGYLDLHELERIHAILTTPRERVWLGKV